MVSKNGWKCKNIWCGSSQSVSHLSISLFEGDAAKLSVENVSLLNSHMLHASGLVSWNKVRWENVFLHSHQSTTTALAFHLYSYLLCARLGIMMYKYDQNCPGWQKSAQSMWKHTLKTQVSEHMTCTGANGLTACQMTALFTATTTPIKKINK